MRIDIEDLALLDDEISQLRSENEYLKIAIDGCNHENAQLKAELRRVQSDPAASIRYR